MAARRIQRDRADVLASIPVINAAFAIETFLDGPRTDETRMAEMMKKGEFLVAVEDNSGRIVAFVYTEKRGQRGYFGMLAVDPALQGTGLGRTMIQAAEEHCRKTGCKHMDIVVLSLRPELLPLYRKMGYTETGTEEFHPSRPLKGGAECQRHHHVEVVVTRRGLPWATATTGTTDSRRAFHHAAGSHFPAGNRSRSQGRSRAPRHHHGEAVVTRQGVPQPGSCCPNKSNGSSRNHHTRLLFPLAHC